MNVETYYKIPLPSLGSPMLIHKDLEDRNLLLARLTLKLEKIMNEKKSKRRIQIRDLQKQEIEEKQERRLLIRLHIFYRILLINL